MLQKIRDILEPHPKLYGLLRAVFQVPRAIWRPLARWRERRLIRGFHRLYYHGRYEQHAVWFRSHWFGVPIQKCPFDMHIVQEILWNTKPDLIIECGVRYGGSTLFMAFVCDAIGSGQILGCDISLEDVDERVPAHPRIELFEGSSTSEDFAAVARARAEGKRVMVILDSDHSAAHVRGELKLHAPLVTPGCYLICEDTNINGHPAYPSFGPGPYEALDEYLATHSGWEHDEDCERHMLTFNPTGFMRRSKVDS